MGLIEDYEAAGYIVRYAGSLANETGALWSPSGSGYASFQSTDTSGLSSGVLKCSNFGFLASDWPDISDFTNVSGQMRFICWCAGSAKNVGAVHDAYGEQFYSPPVGGDQSSSIIPPPYAWLNNASTTDEFIRDYYVGNFSRSNFESVLTSEFGFGIAADVAFDWDFCNIGSPIAMAIQMGQAGGGDNTPQPWIMPNPRNNSNMGRVRMNPLLRM